MAEPQGGRYAPPLPQEALAEIAPDLYWLPGTIGLAPLMRISRNMLVLRHGDELTLVNAVRPDARNQIITGPSSGASRIRIAIRSHGRITC